jgi:hypothetical protein
LPISWIPFVTVDQARQRFDERLREAGPAGRSRLHAEMHRQAFELVWAAADRAGPMTELERARFLLRRLYPDLEGARLDGIMARLETEWAAGTWRGFRRPR